MVDDENVAIVVPNTIPDGTALDATGAELVETYVRTLQSPKSRVTARESLRRIVRVLRTDGDERDFAWHKLTFDAMLEIRERLGHKYPPSTVNMSLTAMRQMLKIGHVLGKITYEQRSALDLVKNAKGDRIKKGRSIPHDELLQLWRTCDTLEPLEAHQLRAILTVLVGAGARREEVCALSVRGFHDGDLYIVGKGDRERKIPIDDMMVEQLDSWVETRKMLDIPHDLMFCTLTRNNKPLSVWALWFKICDLASRAGLVDDDGKATIAPHDFRRTFASRLLELGLDMLEVQRLMGHASVSTTQIYDKRAEKSLADKRRAVRVFDPGGP